MAVIKRGNSKNWFVQFQLGGRTYIRSSKSQDKRIAEALEIGWRREVLLQSAGASKQPISLASAVKSYLDAKVTLTSYVHVRRYTKYLIDHFGSAIPLHDLSSSGVEGIKAEFQRAGYSPQTVKHLLNVLKGVIQHSKRLGFRVPDLNFPTIRVPKTRLRYLSQDEEKRLLASLSPTRDVKGLPVYSERSVKLRDEMQDVHDLVVILLDTGARHGEIAGLKWTQVDFGQNAIGLWRPKVQNQSVLLMSQRVRLILERRHQDRKSEFVFASKNGGPRNYTAGTLRRRFNRAGLKDCSVHTLRHTFATRLVQNGMTIQEVRELLGHSDIKTTMRYAHLESAAISRRAVAVIESVAASGN